jgi:sulfatase modifying factor 1
VHEVCLDDFYIGKYEVTQKEWVDIMGWGTNPSAVKSCDDCPVDNVSINDVNRFIRKLRMRSGK